MKKAQNEIAGFVIIILIVVIIGLVFLSINLRKKNDQTKTSARLSNLISAIIQRTSTCAISYVPNYQTTEDLIKRCYDFQGTDKCLDNRNICEVMNNTLFKALKNTLRISEDSENKAYKLYIYFEPNQENINEEPFLEKIEGNYKNCSSEIGSREAIAMSDVANPGNIWIELEVCKS